ncbi:type I-G CRISPR-associated RAMP protein Csb1/Cas7g [Halorhodospira halophila]|uniref:type I-G CRISPR-associated RAMP protein Csb1/Cas7g n=1 Tax=Halorhodospira halophila TaxID=1053 RepID=UPI0019131109|nr:type I-U CRISPR-associated RAMP protein Csb1/Cas7u [Halorhodospira halophila]MBK5943807.1 type I-U CRISPR-associated protein Cas7 [Halorhodospira halophila]
MASIAELINDTQVVALNVTQGLEPMEGWEVPIFPATYPPDPKTKQHRHDTPYTVNQLKDGRWVATLDTVQSQANRMEASFTGELAHTVPTVTITAGQRTVSLTDLPHRLADAAIRTSDLRDEIRAAFEAHEAGDPLPIAELGPTSLVYGAWDSRDTRVRIPRMIRSEIYAWDVDVFTRSAQFSATFDGEDLGLTDQEWRKGAEVGFAPTPSVEQHGGVVVHGQIRQNMSLHLGACRNLERARTGLGQYILGLALGGYWMGGRDYDLRTGCWLIPSDAPRVEAVRKDGSRDALELNEGAVRSFLEDVALPAATELGIATGETPVREAQFDPKAGKSLIKKGVDE